MSRKTETFKKVVSEKIEELKDHFLIKNPGKVINAALHRVASAEVSLLRHDKLCEKLPIADPRHSFVFHERDRSDRKYRTRFATLQKLLGSNSNSNGGNGAVHDLNNYFGYYNICGKSLLHWRYIQAHPVNYGLNPRRPARAKKINGEFFISIAAMEKLKELADSKYDGLSEDGRETLLERCNSFELRGCAKITSHF